MLHGRRSGRGRALELGGRTARGLRSAGHEVIDVSAGTIEEARAVCAPLVEDGLDGLVVVGGDGVVSLATDLCAGTGTAVGIVPAGTGNDSARSLRIPLEPGGALQTLHEGHRRTVDTLRVVEHDRFVLGSVPSALDARISARAAGSGRRLGANSYTLAALIEIALLRFQPPLHYRLTVDGVVRELEALVVVPLNLPYLGGGLPLAPDADPADGLLDLAVITPVSPRHALGVLRAVRAGRHTDHPAITLTRARQVRIEGPSDIVAQADGDEVGPLPITVEVAEANLQVIAPPLA